MVPADRHPGLSGQHAETVVSNSCSSQISMGLVNFVTERLGVHNIILMGLRHLLSPRWLKEV